MKHFLTAAIIALPTMTIGQDFTAGSTAQSWNLYAEQPAFFAAKVTDALCAITGDCPADCGAGQRQMGLLRASDGVFVLAVKNGQPVFSGAANDLVPWCGQEVEVDGLMLNDPDVGAVNVFQMQKIRAVGTTDWTRANRWTKDWEAAFPDAKGKEPWFRRDPRINADIAETGYLGLGLDVDAAFIAEQKQ